jgi:hypothetical protein
MPVSLQGELGRAGYTTLACVGGGFLTPALGFDAGFDWYWSPQHTPMLADQLGVVTRKLSEDPAPPFFLFLHTYEVHNYFQGWAHSIDRFDRGYLGPLTDPRQLMGAVLQGDPEELTPSDLQYIQDLYDGEIRHTDRYLDLFLDWLRSQPWGEDTIAVVTADHGEALGQHGAMSHGGIPYREVMHVPLLMHLPDGRWRGRRVSEAVALADLMPTLLELAGASPPSGLVGSSLVPLLEGGAWDAERPLLCESRGSALTVRSGNWVYVASRGELEEELYDLATDPDETTNIAEAETDQLHEMRRSLAALAMEAALGYRLLAAGERPGSLTVELDVDGRFGYVDVPTVHESDALQVAVPDARQRVRVALEAGGTPHVVLFDPEDPAATVRVSAWLDGEAVEKGRFHLGARGVQPEEMPVAVGSDVRSVLVADEAPVPEHPDTWGLWLWVPPHADHVGGVEGLSADQIPEGVLEQLRSLGYLR